MRHEGAVVLLTFVLSMHTATGHAATAARGGAIAAAQDPAVVEAALDLDRSTRRVIQQRLRDEGFDPGTPDGLLGPRTRAAIRDWQQSRGAPPTGYLTGTDVRLLRAAAPQPPALSAASPPPEAVPAVDPSASSAADADPVGPESVSPTNTEPSRPASGAPNVQLPPEVMVDRHLVRMERLLADDEPRAALEAMNEILALQDDHGFVLQDDFDFQYARVAFAAGQTERAIASLNEYLVAAGREGAFYREALELLDAAEVRLQREAADRRQAEAERRRAEAERRRIACWPPGHVFRDCETCPEMVVLPGSVVALGRYEVTLAEYRAFATSTGRAADRACINSWATNDHDPQLSWRNPGFLQTDRHPVTCMGWDDVQTYVSWLSRTTGTAYRLPSGEELFRAAESSQRGCHDREDEGTCPVGTNGTNSLGLSDLLGNVHEWTSTCQTGDCGSRRALIGSWLSYGNIGFGPGFMFTDQRRVDYGFRVARTLE